MFGLEGGYGWVVVSWVFAYGLLGFVVGWDVLGLGRGWCFIGLRGVGWGCYGWGLGGEFVLASVFGYGYKVADISEVQFG